MFDSAQSPPPPGFVRQPEPGEPPRSSREAYLEIQEEVMKLCSAIAAAQARVVDLIATHGDGLTGGDDPTTWLAWAAGMKPASAKRHLRLAHRLCHLPKIKESFGKGEISFDKAETIARVANEEREETLLIWAQNGTCSQLTSIAGGFRRTKTYLQGAAALHGQRSVIYHYTDDGAFRLRAQMPAEQGALVAQALEAAEQALWDKERTFQSEDLDQTAGSTQTRARTDTRSGRLADALAAVAETFLATGLEDEPVSDRYQVMVHVDAAALGGDDTGTAEIADGAGVSVDTARRLSCDCSILAVLEKDGVPLHLGRARRTISPSLRKVLKARDRHCVFPGCSNTRWLDGHHVKHWVEDGRTKPENVTLLCRRHHRLVHEGRFSMCFDGKVARFFRPDGSEVERVARPREITEAEMVEMATWGAEVGTWATPIDPCNVSDAVEWMCSHDPDLIELNDRALERLRAQEDRDQERPPEPIGVGARAGPRI